MWRVNRILLKFDNSTTQSYFSQHIQFFMSHNNKFSAIYHINTRQCSLSVIDHMFSAIFSRLGHALLLIELTIEKPVWLLMIFVVSSSDRFKALLRNSVENPLKIPTAPAKKKYVKFPGLQATEDSPKNTTMNSVFPSLNHHVVAPSGIESP
ncbi:hypothetical protein AQUCO_00200668v1 [Aquilegia coerulea]|uniref:Uncharacterized protein n=1 Tax=Aquilegia coerulea TaxID=218851 RepID=A0A2G5F468_AQUCA|nr:hypothetical protein AQUCO_00200668v1 [Aquilegia coerulea]